jgi:hypothetical protein
MLTLKIEVASRHTVEAQQEMPIMVGRRHSDGQATSAV